MADEQSATPKTRPLLFVIAFLIGLLVLTLAYFLAYLAMGTRSIMPYADAEIYNHEWQASVFEPAQTMDIALLGKRIDVRVKPTNARNTVP